MTRSKMLVLVFVILSPLMVGCASGGVKKPTVFVDKLNMIPADIPSQFLNRYERFISDKEQKEFKKLLTDEDRQVFIDKFWLDRDSDPSTLENERKQEIDDRIDDITNERFLNTPGVFGLSFRTNGGFRGDMAMVYLLHGEPDAMDTVEGGSFVPMMLWVYLKPENGRILYAVLFYRKGGGGLFRLFPQDSYQLDQCGAIYEVATLRSYSYIGGGIQSCPDDLYQVYNEIWNSSGKGGVLDGYIFAWALFNFSQDSLLSQGEALEPPKPASEIAKQSKARVTGEASKPVGTAGTDYILASCGECNSMIPAELSLGESITIFGLWKNFDWTISGEYLELSLKYRIVLENRSLSQPIVLEGLAGMRIKKNLLDERLKTVVIVNLLDSEQVTAIPSGTYHVSVYVKNMMTKKYNAWSKEFTK